MKLRKIYIIGYIFAFIAFILCTYVLSTVLTIERRLSVGASEALAEKPFYTLPSPIQDGRPGQLIRSEKLDSTPNGMVGWRILYYSSDTNGKSIIVSGLVVAPETNPDSVKRSIISWAHPTTGIAPRCAPSVGIDPFDSIEGLRSLVAAGYVIAATDYSGMGIEGPPSFLIGKMEGQNVLDAARAAQQLPVINAGNSVVLWGHSQGGHAALFASQMASSYAPDLEVKGVAVAAPATELGALLEANASNVSDVTIGSYAIQSYSKAYNADIKTVLTPEGAEATEALSQYCLLGQNNALKKQAQPLAGHYFAKDPATFEPWATILQENTPGKTKINMPLFVAQGDIDTLIDPRVTQQFVETQKNLGTSVTYVTIPKTGHALVADRALPNLLEWLKQLQ